MIDTGKNRSAYARENGTEENCGVDPDVIEQNKKILKKKIRKRGLFLVFLYLLAMLVFCVLFCEGKKILSFVFLGVFLIFIIAISNSLKRLQQNACPRCFAISSWVHLETRETGRQRTSVTKQVETKHYSSDRQPLAGCESALTTGPHKYVGKSVTKISVPAIRYDYREKYQCKYCGEIKDVDTYKIVEQ